jgi:hypothetical protein
MGYAWLQQNLIIAILALVSLPVDSWLRLGTYSN